MKYEFNEMVWWRFDYKEINKNIVLKLAQFPLPFSILVAFFQGSNFFRVIEASSVKHFAEEKKLFSVVSRQLKIAIIKNEFASIFLPGEW